MQEDQDPYSTYDLDDWQWEFLRRNPRYIKAYKAIEWLKKRLNKKKEQTRRSIVRFNAFGLQCTFAEKKFYHNDYRFEGWTYVGKSIWGTRLHGSLLDLPSPNESSAHYKQLLEKQGAAAEIGKAEPGDDSADVWPLLEKHEIAVAIDTRYNIDEIINGVKEVISAYQSNNRYHVELFPDYLRVWQLRKDKVSRRKIASSLWPHGYKKNKANAIQKTHYCEKKFQELIDESFPAKKRSPKIKK
jgi:hypothetical protein